MDNMRDVRIGLFLVMLTLVFGIGMGAAFGINEDAFQTYITNGVHANPEVHDINSINKIWRYAQRSHFHATGIAAFSIGLIVLTMLSSLKPGMKSFTSFCIGLGGLYPLSWFNMYRLAPEIGRDAAHNHIITETLTYVGVGGLLLGILLLCANLFMDLFSE